MSLQISQNLYHILFNFSSNCHYRILSLSSLLFEDFNIVIIKYFNKLSYNNDNIIIFIILRIIQDYCYKIMSINGLGSQYGTIRGGRVSRGGRISRGVGAVCMNAS